MNDYYVELSERYKDYPSPLLIMSSADNIEDVKKDLLDKNPSMKDTDILNISVRHPKIKRMLEEQEE